MSFKPAELKSAEAEKEKNIHPLAKIVPWSSAEADKKNMRAMIKTGLVLWLLALIFTTPAPVAAQEDFSTDFSSTYQITASGIAEVTHLIKITNHQANVFVSQYSLTVGSTRLENLQAHDDYGPLLTKINVGENKTAIVVNLESHPLVGIGKTRSLNLKYTDDDIATIVGQVLEVNIPLVANAGDFSQYQVKIVVPKAFAPASQILPEPTQIEEIAPGRVYRFTNPRANTGITAVFGDKQVFSFTLDYFLSNESAWREDQAIAIIPDTNKQKVSYQSIEPMPVKIESDQDGNWLAVYSLKPGQKMKVSAKGKVEIYLQDTGGGAGADPADYLKADEYWQTDDPEIINLAKKLKTPRAIYDYVISLLDYDYQRIGGEPKRLGATGALKNPESAICTEYSDLFITLARAAGIPAREHAGFAYTKNPDLRPLSLKKDVLHAWPEYWDENSQSFKQIDPTWSETTGGIDYFSKLDLNHITFAIHGRSSTAPLPAGFYKYSSDQEKTIKVEPDTNSVEGSPSYQVTAKIPRSIPAYRNSSIFFEIQNTSGQAIYNLPLSAASSYQIVKSPHQYLGQLLPWQNYQDQLIIRPDSIWESGNGRITLAAGDKTKTYSSPTKPLISETPLILGGLLLIAASALLIYKLMDRKNGR